MRVQTILPVVLVSIAAMLALTFMLTHFAQQITGNAGLQTHPQFARTTNPPFSLKEVCVFTKHNVDCEDANAADSFCFGRMGGKLPASAATCTRGAITCELPCGIRGAQCNPGSEYNRKRC